MIYYGKEKGGMVMADRNKGLLNMRLSDILLYNSKKYESVKQSMEDGTYKAEQLKKTSEMAKNCDRYNEYIKKYMDVGKVLFCITFVHVIMFAAAVFTADFLLYIMIAVGLAMEWYSVYTKKTAFCYTAPIAVLMGLVVDLVLRLVTIFMFWGIIIMGILIAFALLIVPYLNREYIYLSEQEGFPHFKRILDDETEKNKKALAGEIDRHYAALEAPEDKKGRMDELDLPLEAAEAAPDMRNDYMESI